MEFGDSLKELREKAGMSQEKLARAANVSTSVVSKLEQKLVTDPAWSTIKALARALGVDCTAFEKDTPQPETEPPADQPARPRGRPRKAAAATDAGPAEGEAPKAKRRGRKG